MSDERWIKVNSDQADAVGDLVDYAYQGLVIPSNRDMHVIQAYESAKGQQVETIRWCKAHKTDACVRAEWSYASCRIVDATLILPPREPEA